MDHGLARIAEVQKQPTSLDSLPPTPRRAGTVEVWSHLVVADGVEVTLEPGRAQLSPEQVRAFFRSVKTVYEQLRDEKETP